MPALGSLIAALPLALLAGAAWGIVHGTIEIAARGLDVARYLPLVCIFYTIAGAAAGLAGWLVIAALQILPIGRRLAAERGASLALAASLASVWAAVVALEITYRYLPHELGAPTLALAAGAALAVAGTTLMIAAALPRRIGRFGVGVLALTTAAAAVVALRAQPGVVHDPAGPPGATAGRPHVVFVLIDTLRADHLSAYGYSRETSPRIDEIARSGIRFEHAFSQAPWTKPSVESLFTSRFPSALSGSDIYAPLPVDVPVIAELFRDAGYTTAGFVANPMLNPSFGFQRGFEHFYYGLLDFTTLHLYRYGLWLDLVHAPWYANRSDYLNRHVLRWLDRAAASRRPIFLYVHYMDPHEPYLSRAPFAAAFSTPGVEPIHVLPSPTPDLLPFDALPTRARNHQEIAGRVDAYDACILQNDAAVGELVDELERRGIWQDSVFVLVADHGEEFLDHGGWGHGQSVYQEQIRVPLILRLPGGTHAGTVVDESVMLVDVLPTLAALAGIEPPEGLGGANLMTRLGDREGGSFRPAFAESFGDGSNQRAVIEDRWKWIRARRNGLRVELLFDLSADPAEDDDLMTPAPTPQASRIAADLSRSGQETLHVGARSGSTELEEGLRRRLQELGYIE